MLPRLHSIHAWHLEIEKHKLKRLHLAYRANLELQSLLHQLDRIRAVQLADAHLA